MSSANRPAPYDYQADLAAWAKETADYFTDTPSFLRGLADELEKGSVTYVAESVEWLRWFAGFLPDVTSFLAEMSTKLAEDDS